MQYAPGFYYAFRHGTSCEPKIDETIVRVTKDGRLIDTHNLLSDWYDYEILGQVPSIDELESLTNATAGPFNPVEAQTPRVI